MIFSNQTAKLLLILGLMNMASATAADDFESQKTLEARSVTKEFMTALKGKLQTAVKAGGPANGLNVCNLEAAAIADNASEKTGWDVARTSLKLRNPENKADDWEKAQLESFEVRLAAGENPKMMESTLVTEDNGVKQFRYMKAIPAGKPCMACHGTEVKQEIVETIQHLYPDDQATGYQPGQIRGAFTMSWSSESK